MKSPFKFLDSYTKEDRDIFFGREREIEELYHRVFESKIMLVYGVSGTGKSSLIHCGLANKFQETDWLPLVIRRGGNILDNLALAIKVASITPQTGEILTPIHFKKAVRSLYLDHYKPVFFIFDQFEEIFIFGNKDEKRSFIQTIRTIVDSDIQCRFIFIMREEYMASFTEFERFIPSIFQNRVRIEKMSHINALEAIKGPCKFAGITLEEGFAETLLEKLSPESADVELTYLQVFLDRILKLANPIDDKVNFTTSLLFQVGDVSDLLGSFLDEQISLLSDPDTGLAILKSFVSVKGTKQPMNVEEVRDYIMTLGRNPDEKSLAEMIQSFVSLRILCDKDQHDRYELRHDALAAKIFEKFTLVEKELLEVRKFVENAFYTFETRGILLNNNDIEYLKGYENKLILPQYLNEFVEKSRWKLLSQRRALLRITRISALVFILVLAAVGRYYFWTQASSKEKDVIGSALLQAEANPAKGLVLTLPLWKKYPTSTVLKKLVLKNFSRLLNKQIDSTGSVYALQQYLKPIKLESPVVNLDISKNGKYLFGWMETQRAFIMNIPMKKIFYLETDGEPRHMEISENDSLVGIIYKNSSGAIFDFNGKKKYEFQTTLNGVMDNRLIRFLAKGNYQIAVVKDNMVRIFDKTGKIACELKGHKDRINSIDVSPDGRFLVTTSNDKLGYIWNFNYNTNEFSIYDSLKGHKDIIWSCEFNRTGKYILTSSAYSTFRIWDLNGRELNPTFRFALNYYGGIQERVNHGEVDETRSNPELYTYNQKICNASFSKDELSIIVTGYESNDDPRYKRDTTNNQVLYFDYRSKFNTMYNTPFKDMTDQETYIKTIDKYSRLIVSPLGDMLVVKNTSDDKLTLIAADGLQLINMVGRNVLFSNDGNYIIWSGGNEIFKMPVLYDVINDLLDKYKILDSIKTDKGLFIVM
jgi:WD40 repeat protein